MRTIYINQDNLAFWQEKAKSSVVALGYFDGIHLGHCEVIKTAAEISKRKNLALSVMSFFPHPKTVISNGKRQVSSLMSLSKKEERLRELGVDTFYIIEFTKEFSSLLPAQFVSQYLINLGIVHAVAGFDYSYGFKGAGNMDRLKNDSGGLIEVTKVEKMEYKGEKISSSCIREKLVSGDVEGLPSLLGNHYEVDCEWNGQKLLIKPDCTLPAPGQYIVTLKNKSDSIETKLTVLEEADGRSIQFMTTVPKFLQGRLSIVWQKRYQESNFFKMVASSAGYRF